MLLIAIDPGTTHSAYTTLVNGHPKDKAKLENRRLLEILYQLDPHYKLAVEMVASYGMPVGKEVFETVLWIGRFIEAARSRKIECAKVYRLDVKVWLCHSAKAKDSNIRQALLDLFPRDGGGKTPQVGTKGKPGPLFGFSGDMWAALAVGLYAQEHWAGLEKVD